MPPVQTLTDEPSTAELTHKVGDSLPSHGEILFAIVFEVGCTEHEARATVNMLVKARNAIRDGREYYLLDQRDMDRVHPVLEKIMPDPTPGEGPNPTPGGAWALINQRYLKGDEIMFVHDKTEDEARWCVVHVHVRVI